MIHGKKRYKLKQFIIWFQLLSKRLLRQPAYIVLLVLIPILGYAVSLMEQEERSGATVAVCIEEGTWSGQIIDGLRAQDADSVLAFEFYHDASEAEIAVLNNKADCAFVIPADIEERVLEEDWRKCITVYETSASSITGMAKERISEIIFTLYSGQRYREYMENISEDIVDFAQYAYEDHLTDGSTFGFEYISYDQYSQYSDDTDAIYDAPVFPVKGAFAVIIFISGMCGMLEYEKDNREKRFIRMAPNMLTFIVDVWISTVYVSVAVLICLWISDGMYQSGSRFSVGAIFSAWDVKMWIVQVGRLIVYQCVIVLYCCILGMILRRQETVAAAIPILSLGSLVCAPVFIRLAAYVPVFVVLEKLFPVTYYLMM